MGLTFLFLFIFSPTPLSDALARFKKLIEVSKTTGNETFAEYCERRASGQATRAKLLIRSYQTSPEERSRLLEQYGDLLAQAPKPRVAIMTGGYVLVDGYYVGKIDSRRVRWKSRRGNREII